MENNVNNNVASNTNPTVNTNVVSGVNTSTVNNVAANPVSPEVAPNVVGAVNTTPTSQVAVNPTSVAPAAISPVPVNQAVVSNVSGNVNPTPVAPAAVNPVPVNQTVASNVLPNVNTATVGGDNNNNNEEQKKMKKAYIWIGVFVGLVLIIAGVLLYFLLNGSIANRNRLTCTKTTQEEGYDYYIKRYYTFDNDVMVRVYYTYEFRYNNEFTDDMYNQTFDAIINNETNGITKYGLNTHIEKKENVVEITSYEPNYYSEDFDAIKKNNKDEGYSCE